MGTLIPQVPSIAGTTPTYAAVSASDTFTYLDRLFLIVKNGGGSADTVTVVVPGSSRGVANADPTVSVPAAGERWIGPLDAGLVDPTNGLITIQHSSTASVTCALVQGTA